MNFWFYRFNVLRLVIAFVLIMTPCSCKIHEEHTFEIPVSSAGKKSTEYLLLTVFEKGEWVLAVDGGFRRTSFSKGEYSVRLANRMVRLPYLTVSNPTELWDSFARIDSNLYAIDVTGSPFRPGPPCIKVYKLYGNAPGENVICKTENMDCQIQSFSISKSGETLFIDNKFERYYSCEILNKENMVSEISREEYLTKTRDSIQLTNKPIFIDMGSYGYFGSWCQ